MKVNKRKSLFIIGLSLLYIITSVIMSSFGVNNFISLASINNAIYGASISQVIDQVSIENQYIDNGKVVNGNRTSIVSGEEKNIEADTDFSFIIKVSGFHNDTWLSDMKTIPQKNGYTCLSNDIVDLCSNADVTWGLTKIYKESTGEYTTYRAVPAINDGGKSIGTHYVSVNNQEGNATSIYRVKTIEKKYSTITNIDLDTPASNYSNIDNGTWTFSGIVRTISDLPIDTDLDAIKNSVKLTIGELSDADVKKQFKFFDSKDNECDGICLNEFESVGGTIFYYSYKFRNVTDQEVKAKPSAYVIPSKGDYQIKLDFNYSSKDNGVNYSFSASNEEKAFTIGDTFASLEVTEKRLYDITSTTVNKADFQYLARLEVPIVESCGENEICKYDSKRNYNLYFGDGNSDNPKITKVELSDFELLNELIDLVYSTAKDDSKNFDVYSKTVQRINGEYYKVYGFKNDIYFFTNNKNDDGKTGEKLYSYRSDQSLSRYDQYPYDENGNKDIYPQYRQRDLYVTVHEPGTNWDSTKTGDNEYHLMKNNDEVVKLYRKLLMQNKYTLSDSSHKTIEQKPKSFTYYNGQLLTMMKLDNSKVTELVNKINNSKVYAPLTEARTQIVEGQPQIILFELNEGNQFYDRRCNTGTTRDSSCYQVLNSDGVVIPNIFSIEKIINRNWDIKSGSLNVYYNPGTLTTTAGTYTIEFISGWKKGNCIKKGYFGCDEYEYEKKANSITIEITSDAKYYYIYSGRTEASYNDIIKNDILSSTEYKDPLYCATKVEYDINNELIPTYCTKSSINKFLTFDECQNSLISENYQCDLYVTTSDGEFVAVDKLVDERMNTYSKIGPPANVNQSQSLGFYVTNGKTQLKYVTDTNVGRRVFKHMVEKNGDKYKFYDNQNIKLEITKYDLTANSGAGLIEYTVSLTDLNKDEYIKSESYSGTKQQFIDKMRDVYGLDVNNAFSYLSNKSLFDHIKVVDGVPKFHYSTDGVISAYDFMEGKQTITLNGTVTTAKSYAFDYYYALMHTDAKDVEGSATSRTVVNGSYTYSIKKYATDKSGRSELTYNELMENDLAIDYFDVTYNGECTSYNIGEATKVYADKAGLDETSAAALEYKERKIKECLTGAYSINTKKNVEPGIYYIYVGYLGEVDYFGIENNASLFSNYNDGTKPFNIVDNGDIYMNNYHMARLSYSDPVYSIDIDEPIYSSKRFGEADFGYSNIANDVKIPFTYLYNFDASLKDNTIFTFQKKVNGKWEDWDNKNNGKEVFKLTKNIKKTVKNINNISYVTLKNYDNQGNVVVIPKGEYRIGIQYYKSATEKSNVYYQEFNITKSYYNIDAYKVDDNTFFHNDEVKNRTYKVVTTNIDSYDNEHFKVVLTNLNNGENYETVKGDLVDGHQYYNIIYDNQVAFKFYFDKENDNFAYTHTKNVLPIGKYSLEYSYCEDLATDEIEAAASTSIEILEDRANIELDDYKAEVTTSNVKYIKFDTYITSVDNYDDIKAEVVYKDKESGRFVVSNQFDVKMPAEGSLVSTERGNKGTIEILVTNKANFTDDNYYTFRIYYNGILNEQNDVDKYEAYASKTLPALNKIFDWDVNAVAMQGIYTYTDDLGIVQNEKVVKGATKQDGVNHQLWEEASINNPVALMNNLSNQSLNIKLDTIYSSVISFKVIDSKGNNVSKHFYVHNNSGIGNDDRVLSLIYKNKLTYTVKNGDTFSTIAAQYSITEANLKAWNGNITKLPSVGSELKLYETTYNPLTVGEYYTVIVKYDDNKEKDIIFRVYKNYFEFDELILINDVIASNKKSYLDATIKSKGISPSAFSVNIESNQGQNFNQYFENLVVDDSFNIHATKLENQMPPTEYILKVSYLPEGTSDYITKKVNFNVVENYFNFTFDSVTTEPSILTSSGSATIRYHIKTDGITNINEAMNYAVENIKVFMGEKPDANNYKTNFKITSERSNDPNGFDIVLTKLGKSLERGTYNIAVTLFMNSSVVTKYSFDYGKSFRVSKFYKEFNVEDVNYDGLASDNRLHNNLDWKVTYTYNTTDVLLPRCFSISVLDSSSNDVTDSFDIDVNSGSIVLNYNGSTSNSRLKSSTYTVKLTYYEEGTDAPFTVEQKLRVYGNYKDLKIGSMKKYVGTTAKNDSYKFNVEDSNQNYVFSVLSTLTDSEKENIILRVLDTKNNIVYSTLESEKTEEDLFEVVNNIKTNSTFKLTIKPNKVRIGKYYIEVGVPNIEDNSYYDVSNRLEISMDDSKNKITINDSSIIPTVTIGNRSSINNKEGATVKFDFTPTFVSGYSEEDLSIAIYDNLKLVKELNPTFAKNDNGSYTVEFNSEEINAGNIEFAICIKGVPYASVTETVTSYIPVTDVRLRVNSVEYTKSSVITIQPGRTSNYEIRYDPGNATNNAFEFKISNPDVLSRVSNTLVPNAIGETEVTIESQDVTATFIVRVVGEITSNKYQIDNSNHYIIVRDFSGDTLSKAELVSNLQNLVDDYQLKDVNGNNKSITTIYTGDQLVNAGNTYRIIVKGDVNGDGLISAKDYVKIKNQIMGTSTISGAYFKLAADYNDDNLVSAKDYVKIKNRIMNGGR